MIRIVLGLFLSLGFVSSAYASGPSIAPAGTPYNWSGWYLGAHIGGAWADVDYSHNQPLVPLVEPLSFSASSFAGGVHGGIQQQFGTFVIGVELSYTAADLDETVTSTLVADRSRTAIVDDIFIVALRLGVPVGERSLVYLKGGYASAEVDISSNVISTGTLTSSSSDRESGWNLGVGLEYAWSNNLIFGVQYDYIALNVDDRLDVDTNGFTLQDHASIDADIQLLTVRASWKF